MKFAFGQKQPAKWPLKLPYAGTCFSLSTNTWNYGRDQSLCEDEKKLSEKNVKFIQIQNGCQRTEDLHSRLLSLFVLHQNLELSEGFKRITKMGSVLSSKGGL